MISKLDDSITRESKSSKFHKKPWSSHLKSNKCLKPFEFNLIYMASQTTQLYLFLGKVNPTNIRSLSVMSVEIFTISVIHIVIFERQLNHEAIMKHFIMRKCFIGWNATIPLSGSILVVMKDRALHDIVHELLVDNSYRATSADSLILRKITKIRQLINNVLPK